MTSTINEIVKNLCEVGEFDLAHHVKDIKHADMGQALTCTRYLAALHGSLEVLHLKLRADIVAGLWGYVSTDDDGSYLRAAILICIEQLVRECPNTEEIEPQLLVLASARDASFERHTDLRAIAKLVADMDFDGLKNALVSTTASTASYVQVVGKARFYAKSGSMVGVDCGSAYDKETKVKK